MEAPAVAFRTSAERRRAQLAEFNARSEIRWFGFHGEFGEPGLAVVTFAKVDAGALGGGGTAAINGGVVAAGFDAAFVLAGLGQYDVDAVVTLELSVKFLNLALVSDSLAFQARVIRSARHMCFAQGFLSSRAEASASHYAVASAMLAPVK